MAKTAVFGGTFNPFHIGHYEILKTVCESGMFDRVLLMPDRIPPHKTFTASVPDEDRIEMCRIASADFENAQLCLIEFEREGKSYTVDTVRELKKRYPDDELFLVVGGDMIKSLDHWVRFDLLKEMVSFVAFNRAKDEAFLSDIARLRALGARITVFDKQITEVSSSEFRLRPDSKFLPEKVWEYVDRRGLYKQQAD